MVFKWFKRGKREATTTLTDEDRKESHVVRNLKKEIVELNKILEWKDVRINDMLDDVKEAKQNKDMDKYIGLACHFFGVPIPSSLKPPQQVLHTPLENSQTSLVDLTAEQVSEVVSAIPKEQLQKGRNFPEAMQKAFIKKNMPHISDDSVTKILKEAEKVLIIEN